MAYLFFKSKCKWILFLFLPVFLQSNVVFGEENKNILNLATGSEKGIYYAMGQSIADGTEEAGTKIEVQSTKGSKENLYLIKDGKAQICLAQSDMAYNAYNGIEPFREKFSDIKAIASLYTEAVHILIRSPLYIRKIEDFKGKRISVGPKEGGTEPNALAILGAAGITPNEIQLLNLSFEDSIKAFNENKVDIVFFTAGFPLEPVRIIMQNKSAYLFEPNAEIIQRIIGIYPFFVATNIPSGTYMNQEENITTVGVRALLLGREDLDDALVYHLARSIYLEGHEKASKHKRFFDLNSSLSGVAIPFHSGAKRFFTEKGLYKKELYRAVFTNYILPAILIMLLALAIIKFKKIKIFFLKKDIARVFAFLVLTWIIGSIVLYYAEHKLNEGYSNLFLSLWSALINWINFGQREPFTFTGRVTSIAMTMLGLGGIAWFTGEITSFFIQKKIMGDRWMLEKIKNHYVIINWNDKGERIIEQLHCPDFKEKKPIVIVTESKKHKFPVKEDIFYLSNDTIDEVLLKKAGINLADSVIILADEMSNETGIDNDILQEIVDSKTLLIIFTIRKICRDMGNRQVPISAEILNPKKVSLARFAGEMYENGGIEIISSKYMAANLLSQVAVTPGLTKVYEDLLTFGKNSNEIYCNKVPTKFIGKTPDEFFRRVLELRDKNIHIIPIAISRGGRVYINPTKTDISSIEDGDQFFAICDKKNDLDRVLEI